MIIFKKIIFVLLIIYSIFICYNSVSAANLKNAFTNEYLDEAAGGKGAGYDTGVSSSFFGVDSIIASIISSYDLNLS